MFTEFPTLVSFALAISLVAATANAAEPLAPDGPNASGPVVIAPVDIPPEAAAGTPPASGSSAAAAPSAARLVNPPQVLDAEIPRGQLPTREQLLARPWLARSPRHVSRTDKEARNSGVTTLIAGGINSTIGVGLLAGSLALLSQNTSCNLDKASSSSGCGNALFGWNFLAFGGTHLLVGSILLIVGGTTYAGSAE